MCALKHSYWKHRKIMLNASQLTNKQDKQVKLHSKLKVKPVLYSNWFKTPPDPMISTYSFPDALRL